MDQNAPKVVFKTAEEQVEIVCLSRERDETGQFLGVTAIARRFNANHPERPPCDYRNVASLLKRFRDFGICSPLHNRDPPTGTRPGDVEVVDYFEVNPHSSLRQAGRFFGKNHSTIHR